MGDHREDGYKMALKMIERAAFGLARNKKVNVVLDRIGETVNKLGIRYETGGFRWRSIRSNWGDPVAILEVYRNLPSSIREKAESEAKIFNLTKVLRLWNVCNAEDVVQTAWDNDYEQDRLVDLLLKVQQIAGRNTTAAIEALPHVMGKGYSQKAIIELYEMIVKKSHERACAVFIAMKYSNFFPTREDIDNYMKPAAK
jgi:hypothetical protein